MSHVRPVDLADLLRGRLAEKQAVRARAHLDDCADCRAAYARVCAANQSFDELLAAPLPEVGVIRGEATVRWTRLAPAARVRKPFFVAFGFAAAAAALAVLWNPAPRPTSAGGAPDGAGRPSGEAAAGGGDAARRRRQPHARRRDRAPAAVDEAVARRRPRFDRGGASCGAMGGGVRLSSPR